MTTTSPVIPRAGRQLSPGLLTGLFILLLVGIIVLLLMRGREPPEVSKPHQTAEAVPSAPLSSAMATPVSPASASSTYYQDLSPDQVRDYERSRVSTFETRYREDSLDPVWAASTEMQMLDAATEPALNEFGTPNSYEATCRAHLCKVSMRFKTSTQAEDWAGLYVVGLGGPISRISTSIESEPTGGAHLLIYAARKGSERLLDYEIPDEQKEEFLGEDH